MASALPGNPAVSLGVHYDSCQSPQIACPIPYPSLLADDLILYFRENRRRQKGIPLFFLRNLGPFAH